VLHLSVFVVVKNNDDVNSYLIHTYSTSELLNVNWTSFLASTRYLLVVGKQKIVLKLRGTVSRYLPFKYGYPLCEECFKAAIRFGSVAPDPTRQK
jgi:hypothetical protein